MADAPVAGWYPDPSDGTQLRYWDGSAWSGQTRAAESAATPAIKTSKSALAPSVVTAGGAKPLANAFEVPSGVTVPSASVGTSPSWTAPTTKPASKRATWAILAVFGALVAGGIYLFAGGSSNGGTSVRNDDGGTTYTSSHGYFSVEIPSGWREVTDEYLGLADPSGSLAPVFGGAWTVDGKVTALANDSLSTFEYTGYDDQADIPIDELGETDFLWFTEDMVVSSSDSEVLVTRNGYDAWRYEVRGTYDGVENSIVMYVVRSGGTQVSFLLDRYDRLAAYEDELAEVVDSIVFHVN